jgi:hypothetical protein
MAFLFPASYRPNPRYRGPYTYCDQWRDLPGNFKEIKRHAVEYSDPYGDYWKRAYTVVAPTGLSNKEIRKCLVEQYTFSYCTHEYDCCGCVSGSAREVRKTKGRNWLVIQSCSRNC